MHIETLNALTRERERVIEEIERRLKVQEKVLHSEYEGGYTHALQDIIEIIRGK